MMEYFNEFYDAAENLAISLVDAILNKKPIQGEKALKKFISEWEIGYMGQIELYKWHSTLKRVINDKFQDNPLDLLNWSVFMEEREIATARQTANFDRFLTQNVDYMNRVIIMDSSIVSDDLSRSFIKMLYILDKLSLDNETPIRIIMNCNGGDVYAGLAIYDAICACKNPVYIIVFGKCLSMGSWILQAATKRFMMANSRLMIHKGYSGFAQNHSDIVKAWVDQYGRDEIVFEDILLNRMRKTNPKITREELQKMLVIDTILTPEEAVKAGLADKILGDGFKIEDL